MLTTPANPARQIKMTEDKAILSIQEAANLWGIHRATLYQKINSGLITATLDDNDRKTVQYLDMVRVFGNPKKKLKQQPTVDRQENISNSDTVIELLKQQIEMLKKNEEFYKEEIANIRKDFNDYKALIEYKGKQDILSSEESPLPQQNNNDNMTTPERHERLTTIDTFTTGCNDRGIVEVKQQQQKKGFLRRFFS